jgi:hypothetical protein
MKMTSGELPDLPAIITGTTSRGYGKGPSEKAGCAQSQTMGTEEALVLGADGN